jgi:hypothetical protein
MFIRLDDAKSAYMGARYGGSNEVFVALDRAPKVTAPKWLVESLEQWPDRPNPEVTTNVSFLMKEAAAFIRSLEGK